MKDTIISVKINVSKIDKARLFKGKSGTYLDAVLIPSKDNKYGDDYMVCQSVTKEERQAGTRGAIIGNARIVKPAGDLRAAVIDREDVPPSKSNAGLPF